MDLFKWRKRVLLPCVTSGGSGVLNELQYIMFRTLKLGIELRLRENIINIYFAYNPLFLCLTVFVSLINDKN